MDAAEFVGNWKLEKERYLQSLTEPGTLAAKQAASMKLSEAQSLQLRELLDTVITDVMYTLLWGLDGCASIGDDQQMYKIHDEEGRLISNLEEHAYQRFHGDS